MIQKNDILERKFNKTIRGYDPVEVRYFLEMLAGEFEKLEARIIELEPIEKKLREMKVKSPDELINEAENKAQKIITDAEKLAAEVINLAKKEKEKEKEEIIVLQNKKARLLKSLSDALRKQADLIKSLENGVDEIVKQNRETDGVM